ncbi:MAG: hypothetical protein NVV62_18800 [Terricaulis sp.]|nr:hypothetical protein [Terricaulis sp.]
MSKEADFFYFWIVPLFGFAYAVTTGLLASFVIGAPLHVVLSRLRLRSWLAYCFGWRSGRDDCVRCVDFSGRSNRAMARLLSSRLGSRHGGDLLAHSPPRS